jgi:hypothetical protein
LHNIRFPRKLFPLMFPYIISIIYMFVWHNLHHRFPLSTFWFSSLSSPRNPLRKLFKDKLLPWKRKWGIPQGEPHYLFFNNLIKSYNSWCFTFFWRLKSVKKNHHFPQKPKPSPDPRVATWHLAVHADGLQGLQGVSAETHTGPLQPGHEVLIQHRKYDEYRYFCVSQGRSSHFTTGTSALKGFTHHWLF